MTNIRYTNAQRLALAIKRDAELIAERATLTEADIAELAGVEVGDAVTFNTGRVMAWDEFLPAFRAGEVANAHRAIIEAGGAL